MFYFRFQIFYVLPYIRFLSLVELELWLDELVFSSLINTDYSIPVLKALLGKVFPHTLPHGPERSGIQSSYGIGS